jgi:hypothetical protein
MKELIQSLIQKVLELLSLKRAELLYQTAKESLGMDASPNDVAPDEFGCAETINRIHKKAFGDEIGGGVSTLRMYKCLQQRKDFRQVQTPQSGDIIISPTGTGGTSAMRNGHVGIVGVNEKVMSNSSANGLFLENYTIASWRNKYEREGRYPVYFYRKV